MTHYGDARSLTMIHASSSDLCGREREYVLDCLNRGWITQGIYVRKFEEQFAATCGKKHAIACSSGTAALHLALLALDVKPGDLVLVPALTYIATANAARYCGADIHFVDARPDDWTMDLGHIPAPWLERARVILPVDLYDAVAAHPLCKATVVRDAAHSPGVLRGANLGTLACFSFYASKVIACGEGGMVVTDSDDLARLLRLYRGQGAPIPGQYLHTVVGYNYRMTDLQAAIGLAQLERLSRSLTYRRAIINRYRENLAGEPVTLQGGERAAGWMMAVLLPEGTHARMVAERLANVGVETRPFFEPLPSLRPYASIPDPCPVAQSLSRRGLCLPTHTRMSEADVDVVCDRLLAAIESEVIA